MSKYHDGTPIRVDDPVYYGGFPGRVVFIIEEDSYSGGFPKKNWSYLKNGIGVLLDSGDLFHLDDPDEDLWHVPDEGFAEYYSWGRVEAEDLEEGAGEVVQPGERVAVRLKTLLDDGTVVREPSEEPYIFTFCSGQVIPGLDLGMQGMKVGGKRRILVPPELAYGAEGLGESVPPNRTIIFEVELLERLGKA
jgi:FKBP-type peptidyl-prolyl cis-trans isomerase FkpA